MTFVLAEMATGKGGFALGFASTTKLGHGIGI